MLFPIVIHKDPDSDYGVTVPDLPGCFSAGFTIEEAVTNAREAIELHIEGLLDAGEAVASGSVEAHRKDPAYASGLWFLVDVSLAKLRGGAQRVNITIPERVLGRIDSAARAAGSSRSEFLVAAALKQATQSYQMGPRGSEKAPVVRGGPLPPAKRVVRDAATVSSRATLGRKAPVRARKKRNGAGPR